MKWFHLNNDKELDYTGNRFNLPVMVASDFD